MGHGYETCSRQKDPNCKTRSLEFFPMAMLASDHRDRRDRVGTRFHRTVRLVETWATLGCVFFTDVQKQGINSKAKPLSKHLGQGTIHIVISYHIISYHIISYHIISYIYIIYIIYWLNRKRTVQFKNHHYYVTTSHPSRVGVPKRPPQRRWKPQILKKFPMAYQVFWLVVSTPLKNISQNGNLPQIGVKIKNIWNHHPV